MFLAFDLGLRTTGVAGADWSKPVVSPNSVNTSPMSEVKKHARLVWWADVFTDMIRVENPSEIVVEAPFMHRRNPNGAIQLIMLHGVLRTTAHLHGILVHAVENRTLKKWAVGNGNAPKEDMVTAAAYMAERAITDHNEADAVLLHFYWQENRRAPSSS